MCPICLLATNILDPVSHWLFAQYDGGVEKVNFFLCERTWPITYDTRIPLLHILYAAIQWDIPSSTIFSWHKHTTPTHTVCRHTMTYSIKYHLLKTQAYHSFTLLHCTLVTKWDTLSSNIFRHYNTYSLIRYTFNWQGKSGQFLNCAYQVLCANNFNIMQFVVWTGSGTQWGRSHHTLMHYLHGMLVDTLPSWFSNHGQNRDLSSTFFLPKQCRHYTRWLEK